MGGCGLVASGLRDNWLLVSDAAVSVTGRKGFVKAPEESAALCDTWVGTSAQDQYPSQRLLHVLVSLKTSCRVTWDNQSVQYI
jgi:hypothetical protein